MRYLLTWYLRMGLFFAVVVVPFVYQHAETGGIVDPGDARVLFLDDYAVNEMNGVIRVWHTPQKYGDNPILLPKKAWEGVSLAPISIQYDETEKVYKLRYIGHGQYQTLPGFEELDKVPNVLVRGRDAVCVPGLDVRVKHKSEYPFRVYAYCVAISKDGVHFERPTLGKIAWPGLDEPTNLDPDIKGFYDAGEQDPAKRYKAFRGSGDRSASVSVAWSADGVNWTEYEKNPIIDHSIGGGCIIWNGQAAEYVNICRPRALRELKDKRRIIGRMSSRDFIHWSDPMDQLILVPDEQDGADVEFYHMPVYRYENMWIGFLKIFYNEKTDRQRYGLLLADRLMDVQLAFSRDTVHWTRPADRKPFLSVSPPPAWDHFEMSVGDFIVRDDKLWIYYAGKITAHGDRTSPYVDSLVPDRKVDGGIGLATLRLDGFVSVRAADEVCVLMTKVMKKPKQVELFINAVAKGGSIRTEILDPQGQPIKGFEQQECEAFTGDSTKHTIQWSSGKSLADLDIEMIRIRFVLQNADLYSFGFSDH